MLNRTFKYKNGFTLIEVVFSMAVLLIGLVGVLSLFPVGLVASKKAGDYTTAALVAEQVIANIRSAGYSVYTAGTYASGSQGPPGFIDVDGPVDESATEDADDLPEGFSWEAVVTDTNISNLRRVSLAVYWIDQQARDDPAGYRMENFVTYLAKYN